MSEQGYRPQDDLDIGEVVSTTLKLATSNFAHYFLLCILLLGIPTFVFNAFVFSDRFYAFGIFSSLGSALIYSIFSLVLQASITHSAVEELNLKKVTVKGSVSAAISYLLPLIFLSILMGLGVGIGFFLLIVPGVFLSIIWVACVPALISEHIGVFEAFGRSVMLTEGQRWRILALVLIVLVIGTIVNFVLGLLTSSIFYTASYSPSLMIILMEAIGGVITAMAGSIGSAVLYTRLRQIKDGVDVSQISKVFE